VLASAYGEVGDLSDVGDLGTIFGGSGCDVYEACISPEMRANPSTCGVFTSVDT